MIYSNFINDARRTPTKSYAGDFLVGVNFFPAITIRVKKIPKPDPVNRRPPTARRFYFTEPAVPHGVYIRLTIPSLLA
jgi:hypothetical protein